MDDQIDPADAAEVWGEFVAAAWGLGAVVLMAAAEDMRKLAGWLRG